MPYWLETDTFADDPVWEALSKGSADRLDSLQAAYARLKAKASHLTTDGYLTEVTALRYARNRRQLLDLLCTPVLDQKPKLHRPGDECDCLGDSWIDGYAYRIHEFLKRNPSRAEYNRNRAQRADLRDPRLKALVYGRDGGCCRYCRSGPLSPKAGRARDRRKVLAHDHVDPDLPAGPDGEGLVVSCGRCNEFKGKRTPYEADMVLLPVPTLEERIAWQARGLVLSEREDHARITDETATDHRNDGDPTTDTITDPPDVGGSDPADADWPAVRPAGDDHHPDQDRAWSGQPPGSGRVGPPADTAADPRPPTQPARPAGAPDIYHKRSRATGPAIPAPEYHWPAGSVPATPPDQEAL